jgi:hypothetical protein
MTSSAGSDSLFLGLFDSEDDSTMTRVTMSLTIYQFDTIDLVFSWW